MATLYGYVSFKADNLQLLPCFCAPSGFCWGAAVQLNNKKYQTPDHGWPLQLPQRLVIS